MNPPCEHMTDPTPVTPSGDVCQPCVEAGDTWVHLRLCATCGQVGCCDSSKNRHATAHVWHTGHPAVRSFEPGEAWWWCYPDQRWVPSLPGWPPAKDGPASR